MTVIDQWSGARATALRRAMRLSNERFADKLGVSVRAIAKWSVQPDLTPSPQFQEMLDTVLERCDVSTVERFTAMTTPPSHGMDVVESPMRSLAPTLLQALVWIDDHAGWATGTAEQRVQQTLAEKASHSTSARHGVPRSVLAGAIAELYPETAGLSLYGVEVDGRPIQTSILTQDVWIDAAVPLGPGTEQFTVDYQADLPSVELSAEQADAAIKRVADIVVSDARIFDARLYSLLGVHVGDGRIGGTLGLAEFVPYALTTDLLEDELAQAILSDAGGGPNWNSLPLRRAALPTVDVALDFQGRICVGGALALVAIARPAGRAGEPADYLLLVQERSAQVLNGTGSLSVVPKAFHQPLGDYSQDAAISATIEREFEEELLGRTELEAVMSGGFIDPRHLSRLSVPMRALVDGSAGSWTAECTGFGVNLASGNYEFAGLIAIHDERWWLDHGGDLRGNWETDGVRRYSSRDHDGIAHLIKDDRWSNEGLFAFLQGLRRLAKIAPDRVTASAISTDTRYG